MFCNPKPQASGLKSPKPTPGELLHNRHYVRRHPYISAVMCGLGGVGIGEWRFGKFVCNRREVRMRRPVLTVVLTLVLGVTLLGCSAGDIGTLPMTGSL